MATRLRFYFDENMDHRLLAGLRQYGIAVITAAEAGLLGEKDDNKHLAKSTELGCAVVTGDKDFGRIYKEWLQQRRSFAGIVFIEQKRPRSPGILIRRLIDLYETDNDETMRNRFVPI